MMQWKALQSNLTSTLGAVGATVQQSVQGVDLSSTRKGFATFQQGVRERVGAASEDITELPEEYLELERRVDGLKNAHAAMLRITKVYDTETYDYPTQIQESVSELGGNAIHNLSSWAAAATKGTNLPQPAVASKPESVRKTLPHALSRAAASGSVETSPSKLSSALKSFAVVQDKIGNARLAQDRAISNGFLHPWQATLNSSIAAAVKSRQNVKSARVYLDSCRAALKAASSASSSKQEQARLDVEAAEESLVNATEEAINLMRAVLDNPEPLRNLNELVKAQQQFYAEAAAELARVQGGVEEAAVAAEGEYRRTRG